MRIRPVTIRLLLCAMLALASWPSPALDLDEARHLLLRTGFGATPGELQRLQPMSREQAVSRLLRDIRQAALTPPPSFMANAHPDWPAQWRSKDEERRSIFNRARDAEAAELKAWWWQELIATPSPFTERLVLFWHNHFTSSMDKVRAPNYLFAQNALLRTHARGSFRTLVHAIARDPAMVRYLDSLNNRKAGPNENFARELLELFTLGEGHYGEADIKAAARAFAGWHNDEHAGVFKLNAREIDDGEKSFLGRSGALTGIDVIDAILEKPQVARFITRKLWLEFVSDAPEPRELERLATLFRTSDYAIEAVLRAMLTSPAFWSPHSRATLVKSPVELMVGAIRQVAPEFGDTKLLVEYGKRMRQDLFNPPNVRGWPGGTAWISTESLLVRREALARLASGIPADRGVAGDMARLMLAAPPLVAEINELKGRQLVEALLLDPSYQVK